jgi:hypothetical protein
MLTIGVDYGMGTGDLPIYTVVNRINGQLHIIESGLLDDFCYEQYVGSEHQVVGYDGDIERFENQFKNN